MLEILIADKIAEEGLAILKEQADVTFKVQAKWAPGELAQTLGNFDGVIIRSGVKITGRDLEKPGKLKAIARAGVGVDNVDVEAATRAGVLVMNTPDANTITTAEHTITLMMCLSRKVPLADAHLRAGGWERNQFMGTQLAGKTLGVVGFGRIGRAVAKRAIGLEMKVVAHDPFFFAETAMDGQVKMFKDLDDLLPECDYITVHVPGDEKTKSLINAERIAKCKKGIRFINCARGGIINEDALVEAIKGGQCAGAAIDVYEPEPPKMDMELFRLGDKVVVTPHLGASTAEAQQAVSVDAVKEMLLYLRGKGIQGAVNAGGIDLNLSPQEQAYGDLAMRMGKILAAVVDQGFDSITLRTNGELPKRITPTLQRLAVTSLLTPFMSEHVNVVNAFHLAESRGITIRHEAMGQAHQRAIQHSIELEITENGKTHTVIGTVFADNLPRLLAIKGYWMDMVPAGPMALIVNNDQPGVIGLVGTTFGRLGINIADMTISRKGDKALMILKLDVEPSAEAVAELRKEKPIETVRTLVLPPLEAKA